MVQTEGNNNGVFVSSHDNFPDINWHKEGFVPGHRNSFTEEYKCREGILFLVIF